MKKLDYSKLDLAITPTEIAAIVRRLAAEIKRDYHNKDLVLLGVLKGSFVFLADLLRELDINAEVDFIRAASYGKGSAPSGKVEVVCECSLDLKGRDVLVVEDILDRGETIKKITEHIRAKDPASLKICALLARYDSVSPSPDYLGKRIRGGFLVGYGMDYNENFRGLDGLYVMEEEKKP